MRNHIAAKTPKVVIAAAISALCFGTGIASSVATTAVPASAAVSHSAASSVNMIPQCCPWD